MDGVKRSGPALSKLALQPDSKDYSPAVPPQEVFHAWLGNVSIGARNCCTCQYCQPSPDTGEDGDWRISMHELNYNATRKLCMPLDML